VQRFVSGDAETSNAMPGTPHEEPRVKGVQGGVDECATRSGELRTAAGQLAGRPVGWRAVRSRGGGRGFGRGRLGQRGEFGCGVSFRVLMCCGCVKNREENDQGLVIQGSGVEIVGERNLGEGYVVG